MLNQSRPLILRNRHFLAADIAISAIAVVLSFLIRLEFPTLTPDIWHGIFTYFLVAIVLRVPIFYLLGLYSRYWVNAGPGEMLLVAVACLVSAVVVTIAVFMLMAAQMLSPAEVPRSIPLIDALLVTILVIGTRFSLRANRYLGRRATHRKHRSSGSTKRVLIIGAGQTGAQVLDALEESADRMLVVGFLDDDPSKLRSLLRGVRVVGRTSDLQIRVRELGVKLVIIAIPSADGNVIRRIVRDCSEIGIDYKVMPGLYELASGKITVNALRSVSIEDLLRRTPISLDMADVENGLRGRCVMITGAGGSIGGELVRQIARYSPQQILLVGHGENSLFSTEIWLRTHMPGIPFTTLLADVRDARRMANIFETHRPNYVFHAAAHKHVPMLEANAAEAILNNVMGTQALIDACNSCNIERMVLISSDKAVNPVNVMGMTKRTAELLVLNAALRAPQRFAVVRFGNVLGSRGSVVPIFQQQIEHGGPLTLTSEKMNRFFMSIPEAVLLVLKAAVLTNAGPLFVLNMGEPVRIIDLAQDMIRLSGLEPGRDIAIQVTEPRPGEKLYEELFWRYEKAQLVEQGAIYSVNFEDERLRRFLTDSATQIPALVRTASAYDDQGVRDQLTALVNIDPYATSSPLNRVEPGLMRPKPA